MLKSKLKLSYILLQNITKVLFSEKSLTMKTKYSPGEDDPIIGFCNATSESRESALFFLEGFNWDLDNAVSSFLQGQLPPVKKQPLKRSRSRSPSRWIDSSV
ncbi:unnamed protein product [Eruca vesicaria subsp. sativa]|uniref:Uncharacterized protein n=1 Tax=Eruca vesicaria subsp. sativa TaxID=29727 RepID=A0ABC8J639_ERUVS|nr:unnamed protein product [Eruca vesicaria subsp. sativa]